MSRPSPVPVQPLLDAMSEGVLAEDAQGRVVFANRRLTELCCQGELAG
ncbi:MAG: hypothetical protein HY335_06540, partial [Deinococcus sp.]|nr:hypothetical protein [Deinococcus sp.]